MPVQFFLNIFDFDISTLWRVTMKSSNYCFLFMPIFLKLIKFLGYIITIFAKSVSWHLPSIWRSSVFQSILQIWPACFSKFCIQFIKMLTHCRDFNLTMKGSSLFTETSGETELSKLPTRSFFDASSLLDLLLKLRFLLYYFKIFSNLHIKIYPTRCKH